MCALSLNRGSSTGTHRFPAVSPRVFARVSPRPSAVCVRKVFARLGLHVAQGFASLEFSYISPMTHLEGFYRKLGYELTGVVDTPDGDGWLKEEWRGKVTFPHMAKRLTPAAPL